MYQLWLDGITSTVCPQEGRAVMMISMLTQYRSKGMTKIPPLWQTLHSKDEIDRIETNAAWRDVLQPQSEKCFHEASVGRHFCYAAVCKHPLDKCIFQEGKRNEKKKHTQKKIKVVNAVGCVIPIPRVWYRIQPPHLDAPVIQLLNNMSVPCICIESLCSWQLHNKHSCTEVSWSLFGHQIGKNWNR